MSTVMTNNGGLEKYETNRWTLFLHNNILLLIDGALDLCKS